MALTENNSSAHHRVTASSTLNPNALGSYLSQIGHIPTLTAEEQDDLWQKIDTKTAEISQRLNQFGFVADEVIRLCDRVVETKINPADCFLYSSLLQDQEKIPANLTEQLLVWRERLIKAKNTLKTAFEQGQDTAAPRAQLVAELNKFRLNGLYSAEHLEIAQNYAALAGDGSRELAEERFLLRAPEIEPELEFLKQKRNELGELQSKMAEANLRLVISLANRYRDRGISLDDIIQEGNHGLLLAIQRFDFQLGNKFSTYAGWWIKHHILRAIAQQSRVIRIPLHMVQAIQAMNRTEQRIIQTTGREPETEELAAALDMPVARVSALKKMSTQTISLQSPIGDSDEGSTLEKLIADDTDTEPWRDYARKLLYAKLHEMLNQLPEREKQIIIYRFGLCGQPTLSLAEISRRINLSHERVRQLEAKVMEILRSPEVLKFIDGRANMEDI